MTLLETAASAAAQTADLWSQIFVFVLATFIGLGRDPPGVAGCCTRR